LAAVFILLLLATWGTRAIFEGLPLPDWYGSLVAADVIIGATCMTMLLARAVSNWNCDPNASDPDERIELGRRRALLREEYLETVRNPPDQHPG
jgi:hypothetical protein